MRSIKNTFHIASMKEYFLKPLRSRVNRPYTLLVFSATSLFRVFDGSSSPFVVDLFTSTGDSKATAFTIRVTAITISDILKIAIVFSSAATTGSE
jgi:hypothetical protein